MDIENCFVKDLKALLCKYNATMDARDHWQGYAECGKDIRIEVDIPAFYKDNKCIHDNITINLGTYVDGKNDS